MILPEMIAGFSLWNRLDDEGRTIAQSVCAADARRSTRRFGQRRAGDGRAARSR